MRTVHLAVFFAIVLSSMCSYKPAAAAESNKTVFEGMSEMVGHYAKVLAPGEVRARPPTRLKIAIVGLPRTGTGSLIEALSFLGYTTLHADEYLETSDLFAELAETNDMGSFVRQVGDRGFDAMYFWSYDFVEWAAAAKNEDVKVILTVRDTPQKWAKSWSDVGASWDTLWFSRPFIWWKPMQQLAPILHRLFKDLQATDVGTLEKTYTDHIDRVQKAVPEDRLLVFNAKQGWDPLCQFLGHTTPPSGEAFPHANERYLLQLENYIVWVITWIWPVFPLLCLYVLWIVVSSSVLVLLRLKKNEDAVKKLS